jgi:hypothetical protein
MLKPKKLTVRAFLHLRALRQVIMNILPTMVANAREFFRKMDIAWRVVVRI